MTQRGFTLVELMVVVLIVAILSMIAVPTYQAHLQRTWRSAAKAALLNNAQFLERNFTESYRYDQTSAGAAVLLPVTSAPSSGTVQYTITATLSQNSYILIASPTTTGIMVNDSCGVFQLNETGQQTIVLSGQTISDSRATSCWNQ